MGHIGITGPSLLLRAGEPRWRQVGSGTKGLKNRPVLSGKIEKKKPDRITSQYRASQSRVSVPEGS